ncbi:tetratricopeptide repeat protein, partial [uncultured Muribaculum sp.]
MLRAVVKLRNAETERLSGESKTEPGLRDFGAQGAKMLASTVMADIDKVIELSPRMAFAHYNKGNVLVSLGDYTSAISAYTKAIELKADLGEAYYNRGYLYLMLGNKDAGIADLSKAGELGIVPSYNLLKRMTR